MAEQTTGAERRTEEEPATRQVTRNTREELWRGRIEQQTQSGLSVRAFCRREGVAEHSFYQWRRKFAQPCAGADRSAKPALPASPSGAATFARIETLCGARDGGRFGGGMIEIESRGGYLIRLGAGLDRSALIAVLGAIEALGR